MKAQADERASLILIAVAGILLSVLPMDLSADARDLKFEVYTSIRDNSVKVGYPKGWLVQESEMGLVIQEKRANDSAGILIFPVRLLNDATTREMLAETMLNALRQAGYSDLTAGRQKSHPEAPNILEIEATFSIEKTPFRAYIWCIADKKSKLGVFAFFSAPENRYSIFNPRHMLYYSLSPMLGLEDITQPKPSGSSNVNKDILYIRKESNNHVLCTLDPSSGKITKIKDFGELPIAQPTRSRDGSVLILTIPVLKRLMVARGIKKYEPDLPATAAFLMPFTLEGESYIYSPSISRDNSLVAVGMIIAGNVSSNKPLVVSAVNVRGKLASFRIGEKIQEHALYYEEPLDAYRIAWCSAFSPVEDILVYISRDDFLFVDSGTGEVVRRITPKIPVRADSGFAFSPDGSKLVYIGGVTSGSIGTIGARSSIVVLDIVNNTSREYSLSENIYPASITTVANISTINPDFSPDGRSIVFGAENRHASGNTGKTEVAYNIYILDLDTGKPRQVTTDGRSFDPVWKGR